MATSDTVTGEVVSRAKKLNESPKTNLIYKGSLMLACGLLVYLSRETYEKVNDHDTKITHIATVVDNLQTENGKTEAIDSAQTVAINALNQAVAQQGQAETDMRKEWDNFFDNTLPKLWGTKPR